MLASDRFGGARGFPAELPRDDRREAPHLSVARYKDRRKNNPRFRGNGFVTQCHFGRIHAVYRPHSASIP